MQSEKTSELMDQINHLVNYYQDSIKKDMPYKRVFPVLKAIKRKKQELELNSILSSRGVADHGTN